MAPADSVAAQVAGKRQRAALPPDRASQKLHAKHFKRGKKLRDKGKLKQAVEELAKAMAHHPNHVPTLLALGNTYFDLGNTAEARGVLAQAIKADPKNGKAWLVFAIVLQEENEKGAAIKAYRRFLELEPEDDHAGEVQAIIERLETQ